MYYRGFGAWCAAYAFLNTVDCPVISPELYELLSGIPFGLKHRYGDSFRILTPLTEPCLRVEATSSLLGYNPQKYQFSDIPEVLGFLSGLPIASRVMVGPIDMGYLSHLPQYMYYCGQSHYISVEKRENNRFLVIDSEGVLGYKYESDALHEVLNVNNIPEANGLINIWCFEKQNNFKPINNWGSTIINTAANNLQRAEIEGQGSQAILACADFLAGVDMAKWYLRLFYELNYLIQRKNLLLNQLIELYAEIQIELVEQQLHVLCSIRKDVMYKAKIKFGLFRCLADNEQRLAVGLAQLTSTPNNK